MTSISIKGVDETIAKLGKATTARTLRPPTERSVKRIVADLRKYPPSPAGSTYRRGQDKRSEDLGGSWTSRVTSNSSGVVGRIGNNTSYGPWVQSHQFQARHMRHWTNTDQAVIDKNRKAIVADFERAIEKALK